MTKLIRVYVSSTYEDLREYRKQVNDRLVHLKVPGFHIQPEGMEGYPSMDERPLDLCTAHVRECEVYLCIIGVRYGWIPPENNPHQLSITHLEYLAAESSHKNILFLIADGECPIPAKWTSMNGINQPKFDQFLSTAKERCVSSFKSPEDCGHLAEQAVRHLLTQSPPNTDPPMIPTPKPPRIRIGGTPLFFGLTSHQFKNRVHELSELRSLIKGKNPVAIVIKGDGGMGKSELAGRLCAEIHGTIDGSGGEPMPWALDSPRIGAVIYEGLRRRLHDKDSGEETFIRLTFNVANFWEKVCEAMPPKEREQFNKHCSNPAYTTEKLATEARHMLGEGLVVLVLDNLEDVLLKDGTITNKDLQDILDVFLAPGSAIRVLITTRVTPRLLNGDPVILGSRELSPLATDHCIEILREKDSDGRKRTGLSQATHESLKKLAETCKGIPRALDLSAAYLERENERREFRGEDLLTPEALANDAKKYNEGVLNFLLKRIWDHALPEEIQVATTLALVDGTLSGVGIQRCTELSEDDAREALRRLKDSGLIRYDESRRGYAVVDRDRDYLKTLIPVNDQQSKYRKLAAQAALDKVPPAQLSSSDHIRAYDLEFNHLLAAGDARAAWNAISPICPDKMWEKNLASSAFPWFEALFAIADLELRSEILPFYASLLFKYARWHQLLPIAEEKLTNAKKSNNTVMEALALNSRGSALKELARFTEAEADLRRVLRIVEDTYGPNHPTVSTALNNLAMLLKDTNRLAEAEALYRRALEINEATYGKDHPFVAILISNLAQLLGETNRFAEAEPLYRRALVISEATYGKDHPTVAIRINNLAGLLRETNRFPEAEPLFRRAIAIDEASYGADDPNVAIRLRNLAELLAETNRFAEAEALNRRALMIDEATYGADHPRVAIDLNNLALLLQNTNRLAEAEPLHRRALVIDEATYGKDHPTVATDLGNLGRLLAERGRGQEAVPRVERALAIDTASFGAEHWNCADDRYKLATALLARSEPSDAERSLNESRLAVEGLSSALSPTHQRVARALRTRAKAEIANKLLNEAVKSLRESIKIYEALDIVPLKKTADAYAELADALTATGDTAAATDARTKSADYRTRFDAQEAEGAAKFPLPPLPDWVQKLIDGEK